MTIKNRLAKLEKEKHINEDTEIHVTFVMDDPDDPNYVILDPYGKNPVRMSKAEHEAENERLRPAGETVIIVDYVDKTEPA